MTSPLVSVIMPVHNSVETMAASIRSVIGQSHQDWELLVTDDASTDGSWALLTDLASRDERIKPERQAEAGGPAQARNAAISRAAGTFVAFLDSDDLWLPEKLDRQVEFARAVAAPLTFTSYYKVAADFADDAIDFGGNDRLIPARGSLDYRTMLQANFIGCLTAMYDRERLGTRLMPELRKRQDYALWLSILRDGTMARGLAEPLALYRDGRPGSVSSNKLSLVRYNWQLYRDVEKLSLPRSALSLASATLRSVLNGRV